VVARMQDKYRVPRPLNTGIERTSRFWRGGGMGLVF
jgi:hypothetical protein